MLTFIYLLKTSFTRVILLELSHLFVKKTNPTHPWAAASKIISLQNCNCNAVQNHKHTVHGDAFVSKLFIRNDAQAKIIARER